jgi:hypothetical protein
MDSLGKHSGFPQYEVHMGQGWIKISAFNLYFTGAGIAIILRISS